MASNNDNMRLNKAISNTGYCSRRKADELIFTNHVSVNGIICGNPAMRINADDDIAIDGKILNRSQSSKIYLMLNKPVQIMCTLKDPEGRKTIIDILPEKYRHSGLYPVGRLDYFSEGLLLLTNDGEFANLMAHPKYNHAKCYEVLVRGNVSKDIISQIEKGVALNDGTTLLPITIASRKLNNGTTLLTMSLSQGINRMIRKICDKYELTILKLKRISQGPLKLGSLPTGSCRELTVQEMGLLACKPALNKGKEI